MSDETQDEANQIEHRRKGRDDQDLLYTLHNIHDPSILRSQ